MAKNKSKQEIIEEEDKQEETIEVDPVPEQENDAEAPAEETVPSETNEWKDSYVRLLAEFDNYRKRTLKERDTLYTLAAADTVAKLLPVFDNLERALKHETTDEAYKKGVEMTFQQFINTLTTLGVTEIAAVGDAFDPEKHDAVMHIEDDNLGKNVIVEVFERGFMLKDKIIRHATVKVAN